MRRWIKIMRGLKELYKQKVMPELKKELGIKNALAVPRIIKVVVNIGIRQDQKTPESVKTIASTLKRITGQEPVATKARKSIATFKIREGTEIGFKVTLRGNRMDDFLTKLIHNTMPRVRDFRGIPVTSVDRKGNLSIGLKEHIVFPEINADEVERIHGLEITIATSAKNREEGIALFKALGFPLKQDQS